jgi:hypothetical protein
VPAHEINSYRDSLDLLHRFAPTPLKVAVPLECASVILETNDLRFFPATPTAQPATAPATESQLPHCLWKIVRDVDNHRSLTEASIVMAGSLIVYSLGPACIMAADRERQEVLAFIGTKADGQVFRDTILPALVRLTEFVTSSVESASVHSATPVSVGDTCNA